MLLIPYFIVLILLAFYGMHRYQLVYLYYKHRKNKVTEPESRFTELPRVTIQLPIFNEQYVIDRLVECVCKIEYPREKLQIQVLDDSTDETVDVARAVVERYAALGHDICYLHRTNREGFKAGALDAGPEDLDRRVRRHLRRRFHASARLADEGDSPLHQSRDRNGADALGAFEPQLFVPHRSRSHSARRTLHPRARRPLARRRVLQLQRHGGNVAAQGHRRRWRLGTRHAHRRHRSQLSLAACRMEVPLPAGRRMSGGTAHRDDGLQDAAGALGKGPDSVRQERSAKGSARRRLSAARRSKRGIT